MDDNSPLSQASLEQNLEGAFVIIVSGDELLCESPTSDNVIFSYKALPQNLISCIAHRYSLGVWREKPCFVAVVDVPDPVRADYSWQRLRSQFGLIDEVQFQFIGAALQLAHWHQTHQYCGRCGTKTRDHLNDRAKECPQCGMVYFPRISPCVIGVVRWGQQILLAHNVKYRERRFSALAGFIEPGESAEQALEREIAEEVSISIKNIRYVKSQPWPFPGQLMLGFIADYAAGEIREDAIEIDEANWFTIDNLPALPPKGTLSRDLVDLLVEQIASES